jgi:hypothetical protein
MYVFSHITLRGCNKVIHSLNVHEIGGGNVYLRQSDTWATDTQRQGKTHQAGGSPQPLRILRPAVLESGRTVKHILTHEGQTATLSHT